MILLGIWSVVGLVLFLGPWTERGDWEHKPMWVQGLIFLAYGPLAWSLIVLILLVLFGVQYLSMFMNNGRKEKMVTRSVYRASPEVREDSRRNVHETSRTAEMPE